MSGGAHRASVIALALAGGVVASCATIPRGRHGVADFELEGAEQYNDHAIATCLITQERDRFAIDTSFSPNCGEPPFDDGGRIELWRRPWSEWPVYDETAFRQDLRRIERWYEARGHYDVRIEEVRIVTPDGETHHDLSIEDCTLEDTDDCIVEILVRVHEGAPVIVRSVDLQGVEDLPEDVRAALVESLALAPEDRFDEALYERTKERLRQVLGSRGYALAEVEGRFIIDRTALEATVELRVRAGPKCTFGTIRVTGAGNRPTDVIRDAVRIDEGDPYSEDALMEAQRAVHALGSFSAVTVEPERPESGSVIDVHVHVTPGREQRYQLGVGIQGGVIGNQDTETDVPMWDVHLITAWEHRNLFGGLRRLRIEDRPRIVFLHRFPRPDVPRFGNLAALTFRQPAFLEPRTTFVYEAKWDYGPDPFEAFFRHDAESRVGLERLFLDHKLSVSGGLHGHLYRVTGREVEPLEDPPTDSDLLFFEQRLQLDLRDDETWPTLGLFAALSVHEAGYILPSSWDYVRLLPELRAYVPLGSRLVLAGRFGVAMLFLEQSDQGLREEERLLGPRQYRIRGGGANSNRGFLPGQLGDGPAGGLRRWLASIELRLRVTKRFGVVSFADAGDVHSTASFRWDHAQLSVGAGLRYATLVGPIRLDVAGRVPGAQVFGTDDRTYEAGSTFGKLRGAIHLTIGNAF